MHLARSYWEHRGTVLTTMRVLAHIHTFNDADIIDRTIESVLKQTRPVDGILVVDKRVVHSAMRPAPQLDLPRYPPMEDARCLPEPMRAIAEVAPKRWAAVRAEKTA